MTKVKWIGQLSTTEPHNHIGLIKVRQGNVNSEIFEFQVIENNIPYDLTGLAVFFNTHFSRFSPVQQRATVVDAKKGIIRYTMSGPDMQKAVTLQPAYFEFRSGDGDDYVGSTQTFHYHIIKSIYEECTDGQTYIVRLEELFELYQDFFNNQSQDWLEFLEANREILESIDPGGKILIELIDARHSVLRSITFPKLNDRLNYIDSEIERIGINVEWFRSNNTNDMEMFQAAIDYAEKNGGGTISIPSKEYFFDFKEGSTIKNPTRVFIQGSNIHLQGVPGTKILLRGLSKEYLFAIDDHNSSGRDIFTAFSFCGGENVSIDSVEFLGEYSNSSDDAFRFKSPRQICVGFKGCKNFTAKNISGENILGNVLNAVNSMKDFDVEFKLSDNFLWENCSAIHCLENGFNAMGGTKDFTAKNLKAYYCGNGLESASDGFYGNNLVLERNKSTNISLSGSRQLLSASMLNEASGNEYANSIAGYGMILSGHGGLIFSELQISGNYSSAIFLYPKTKRIQGSNSRFYYNAENDKYGITVHMQSNVLGDIEGISLDNIEYKQVTSKTTACFVNGTNVDNIDINNCFGSSNGNLAINIYGQNTDVTVKFNNFDKPVNVNSAFSNVSLNSNYKIYEYGSIPKIGDLEQGDLMINTKTVLGDWSTARCIITGSLDKCDDFNITAVAGNKDATINKKSNYRIGMFIVIDGEPSPKRIVKIEETKLWFDSPFENYVTNAVARTKIASIVFAQAGVNTSISNKPLYIGQMAVVGSKAYIGISTVTGLDWKEISIS